LKSLISDIKTH